MNPSVDSTTAPYSDLSLAHAPPWGADDEWLECVQVRDETHDVRTFVLRPVQARSFRYLPGQFLTLRLEIAGEPVHRCYTLSSSPTRPDTLAITVKRVPGGLVSNWLHDNLRPGARLSATGPAGTFCFQPGPVSAPARGQLYLSGGSGITPLMSMSRAWADLGLDADVHFIHAARTPQDTVFAHELEVIARALPRWRSTLVCESRGTTPGHSGLLGRLSLPVLRAQVPDFLERDVWCCGPAPFMAAVRDMLREAGFDMARHHEESFTFENLTATEAAQVASQNAPEEAGGVRRFTITLKTRGERFECGADETVLGAAQRAGIRWPFSCANGVCGTCRTRKSAGEIEMNQNGGLRPREVVQGWMLPCCSKPLSDLELDR